MKIGEIILQIVEGNNLFTKSHQKEYYESFKAEQRPYITLVTCSDSRVPLNALMKDTSNKVFSIQNIGNQILSTEGSIWNLRSFMPISLRKTSTTRSILHAKNTKILSSQVSLQ